MIRHTPIALSALLALAFFAPVASATTFDNKPKLLLHVRATTTKSPCTTAGFLSNCQTATTAGTLVTSVSGPFYFVYLLAARGSLTDLAGLQCGISYQGNQPANISDGIGIDVFGWSLCATLEFVTTGPNAWPRPGGGNLITWDASSRCQSGDSGVAGYFYVGAYSTDQMSVTRRPVDNKAAVVRCNATEPPALGISDLGTATFNNSGTGGCNPCLINCSAPVGVENTTWSVVKTLIRP
ncbi:MAG: hypothetical protein SGI90_07335 [Candidatus Eisenbacteria bacterium]|nr:hypothetical protein [Candidatus Eisenbacteria bacterium]